MFLRIAGFMTVIAVIYKLILFLFNLGTDQMAMLSIFGYLLIILVGSFFAVRAYKTKNPRGSYLDDVKAGMKSTTLFALFFSAYIYIHYSYVDTHYFPALREARMEQTEKLVKESDNKEEAEKAAKAKEQFGETLAQPQPHATITLLALTITGAIYTLLIVVMMRRMPGFR